MRRGTVLPGGVLRAGAILYSFRLVAGFLVAYPAARAFAVFGAIPFADGDRKLSEAARVGHGGPRFRSHVLDSDRGICLWGFQPISVMTPAAAGKTRPITSPILVTSPGTKESNFTRPGSKTTMVVEPR